MNIRFLPLMIGFSIIMLVIKIADVFEGSNKYSDMFLVDELRAAPADKNVDPMQKTDPNSPRTDPADPPHVSTTKPLEYGCTNQQYSDVELEILQSLSKRREAIDNWGKEVATKESVLKVAELKIDKKLDELDALKTEVNKLLALYNEKEDVKISSLVKIYESMKPKDAAKIFEGLEMPILLEVIDKMKQAKVAPILAQMSPEKATLVTLEYARQKRLPNS